MKIKMNNILSGVVKENHRSFFTLKTVLNKFIRQHFLFTKWTKNYVELRICFKENVWIWYLWIIMKNFAFKIIIYYNIKCQNWIHTTKIRISIGLKQVKFNLDNTWFQWLKKIQDGCSNMYFSPVNQILYYTRFPQMFGLISHKFY